MRILVTGSRNWTDYQLIHAVLLNEVMARVPPLHASQITVMHGAAAGADHIVALFAGSSGWNVDPYPADWAGPCDETCRYEHRRARIGGGTYCPAAGTRRNTVMVSSGADVCLAFPMPGSRGTWDCVNRARAAGIRVEVHHS